VTRAELEPDRDAATAEPRLDTWRWQKYAGAWCITPLPGPMSSASETNAWFATTLTATLDAFDAFARARRVQFGTLVRDEVAPVDAEWRPDERYDQFVGRALEMIRTYPAPIYSLRVALDLCVHVRTDVSPNVPVRAWVKDLGGLALWGSTNDSEPYVCFEIAHTLFRPVSVEGDDNTELHALNQPLLERGLRRWEERLGSIGDVEGLGGIFRYGFAADDAGDAAAADREDPR
jgi:hypothetical protein